MSRRTSEQVVLSRRLKPVYGRRRTSAELSDAVDNGNNKKAIQEAEKLLKKHPATHTAKALKALALIRMERNGDAWPLVEECDRLMRSEAFDEGTLQVLCHCYKEAYMPARIPELLECVLKQIPKNEALLLDLFNGYARIKDFKNQQRVAQMLCKDFNKRQYVFWTISSVVLQASANPLMGPKVLFPLAQKMIEKVMGEMLSKPPRAEVLLYVQILEGQKKTREAFEFVKKHIETGALNDEEGRHLVLDVLGRGALLEELAQEASAMIPQAPFDVSVWQAVLKAYSTASRAGDEPLKKTLTDALSEMLRKAEESVGQVNYRRHSLLVARCMVITCLLEHGVDKAQVQALHFGTLLQNLVEITTLSFDRPYCFKEIARFLPHLTPGEQESLLTHLEKTLSIKQGELTYAGILRELLRNSFGFYEEMDAKKRRDYVLELVRQLIALEKQEPYFAMAVSLIAANVMWGVYLDSDRSQGHLEELALLLELVWEQYSNNYVTALLALRVHALLGNLDRVQALLKQLDVKYIQRHSLGYLNFGLGELFGRFRLSVFHYTNMSAFGDQNDREIATSIVTAYRAGSVDQVASLVQFAADCEQSIYGVGADVCNRLLSSCHAVESLEVALLTLKGDDDKIVWDRLIDNRDFNVLNSLALYDPAKTEQARDATFRETLDLVKLRQALCKAVSDVGLAEVSAETLAEDVAALRTQLDHCKTAYGSPSRDSLQAFGCPLVKVLTRGPFLEPVLLLLDWAVWLGAAPEAAVQVEAEVRNVKLSVALEKMLARLGTDCKRCPTELPTAAQALTSLVLCQFLLKFMETGRKLVLSPSLTSLLKSAEQSVAEAGARLKLRLGQLGEGLRAKENAVLAPSDLLADGTARPPAGALLPQAALRKQADLLERSLRQSWLEAVEELLQASGRVQESVLRLGSAAAKP